MFPRLNPSVRSAVNDTELTFNSAIATQPATSGAVSDGKEAPEQPETDGELYPYLMQAMVTAI